MLQHTLHGGGDVGIDAVDAVDVPQLALHPVTRMIVAGVGGVDRDQLRREPDTFDRGVDPTTRLSDPHLTTVIADHIPSPRFASLRGSRDRLRVVQLRQADPLAECRGVRIVVQPVPEPERIIEREVREGVLQVGPALVERQRPRTQACQPGADGGRVDPLGERRGLARIEGIGRQISFAARGGHHTLPKAAAHEMVQLVAPDRVVEAVVGGPTIEPGLDQLRAIRRGQCIERRVVTEANPRPFAGVLREPRRHTGSKPLKWTNFSTEPSASTVPSAAGLNGRSCRFQ